MTQAHTNRLAGETSPYLLQHAHNPVDWYPWGDEALGRARLEDKPILLSVGYSACHWCHVMEQECFENEDVARLMNEHFVCIKVDREERPDIDHVYMEAVQTLTGGGGWPMTVFLTPEGEPFYGGTYFPPEDRHGLPAFPRVLTAVSEAYRERRSQVVAIARDLVTRLSQVPSPDTGSQPPDEEALADACLALEQGFDNEYGGFGPGPKFPQAPVLEFLLRHHHRTREARSLQMVQFTLDRMAAGGIYDQIGGGFHRYATDGRWLIPHFEKMLYDNALLSRLYLHAYQVTGNAAYRRIVEETLDYVLREMTAPSGGFYSSQDADVDGQEGRYYLWTPGEIIDVLGEGDGRSLVRYFGLGGGGDFEGGSVLHVPGGLVGEASAPTVIARAKCKLLAARERRTKPGRDEKVLASWNGLMLQALAEASAVLCREDYLRAAEANASFLLSSMVRENVLMHSSKDGASRIPGYLEDYAAVTLGLLRLHEAGLEQRWLQAAFGLANAIVQRFGDEKNPGLLFDTAADQGRLFTRPRETSDSVKPCGGSSAAEVLLRVSRVTGDASQQRFAAAMLGAIGNQMTSYPLASGNWLCVLDLQLSDPEEIVVVGGREDPDTSALIDAIHGPYLPNKVLVGVQPDGPVSPLTGRLTGGRASAAGRAAAYVCHRRTCHAPIVDPDELRRVLED